MAMAYYGDWDDGTSLYHYGVRGQRWGVRRYQNPDGTLTEEGKKRYRKQLDAARSTAKKYIKYAKSVRPLSEKELIENRNLTEAKRRLELEEHKIFKSVPLLKNDINTFLDVDDPDLIDFIEQDYEVDLSKVKQALRDVTKAESQLRQDFGRESLMRDENAIKARIERAEKAVEKYETIYAQVIKDDMDAVLAAKQFLKNRSFTY